MGRVSVSQSFSATLEEALTCWCDVDRWPKWMDEVARIVAVGDDWPRVGANVRWESGPAGRGRVDERVVAYDPLGGLTTEVEDPSLRGTQWASFRAVPDGVLVELGLDYSIKRRSPLIPVIDRLFVRRPMIISLSKTLSQFGAVLTESRSPGVG